MNQNIKIAVIGGSGRTGQFVVKQLLNKGFQLRLLIRDPEKASEVIHLNREAIEVVEGDVLDFEKVKILLAGCQAVISTVGQRKDEPLVASQATLNILRAIEETESMKFSRRYILVAGMNVDTPFDKKGVETQAATEWMRENFPSIHEDRQRSYGILSGSDAVWTMVRVPFIEFTENESQIVVSLEDSPGSKIAAAGIAGFLTEQLTDQTYLRKAPFIANI